MKAETISHTSPTQILRLPEPRLGLGQGFAQNDKKD